MINDIEKNLKNMAGVLNGMSDELYSRKSHYLFGSTIGKHIRHILEIYDVLLAGYSEGKFSFDHRERNQFLEENVQEMQNMINKIISEIQKKDKELLCVVSNHGGEIEHLKTTYFREMLYCFEHGIHHQALIKVALKEFEWKNIPHDFGVAPSTIKFRLECAQ